MTQRWGLWGGLALFAVLWLLPPPVAMPLAAWRVCALAGLMAVWWMTQALPLTATALLPFLILPLAGVMTASDAAAAYAVASANLGYKAEVGRWTLNGFLRIDNLLARRYVGSVIVNEGNGRYFEPAAGRNHVLNLSASYRF